MRYHSGDCGGAGRRSRRTRARSGQRSDGTLFPPAWTKRATLRVEWPRREPSTDGIRGLRHGPRRLDARPPGCRAGRARHQPDGARAADRGDRGSGARARGQAQHGALPGEGLRHEEAPASAAGALARGEHHAGGPQPGVHRGHPQAHRRAPDARQGRPRARASLREEVRERRSSSGCCRRTISSASPRIMGRCPPRLPRATRPRSRPRSSRAPWAPGLRSPRNPHRAPHARGAHPGRPVLR